MSPEAAIGASPAPTRDIWALGITLYELISGQLPYLPSVSEPAPIAMPKLLRSIISEPVPAITLVAPNLPPRLISLIHWMLEKDPAKRIGSMRLVAAELEAVLFGLQKDSPALMTGDVVSGRYRLQTNIAEGAFAQVFRAADVTTGQTVAVKRLKAGFTTNPAHIARFRRESRVLEQLDHPGIIRIRDAVEIGNDYYIVMDYIAGGDLRTYLQQRKRSPQTIVKIAQGLAEALICAHDLNIIHRDIKPDNVLMSEDGTPRLSDFGLAHIDNATFLTESGAVMGTVHYIAPEIIKGSAATKQSDIWSFGVLLYEMLAGSTPFGQGTTSQLIFAILNAPIPLLPDSTPPDLTNLIDTMLQRDPTQRIESMKDVARRLAHIAL